LGDIADGEVSFVLSILGIREYKLLHRVYWNNTIKHVIYCPWSDILKNQRR
jgi:hypothetical protein